MDMMYDPMMPRYLIVGFVGSAEVCRYAMTSRKPLEADEIVKKVWKLNPFLNNETARIYINGIPASRRDMGQSLINVGEE